MLQELLHLYAGMSTVPLRLPKYGRLYCILCLTAWENKSTQSITVD